MGSYQGGLMDRIWLCEPPPWQVSYNELMMLTFTSGGDGAAFPIGRER